MTENIDMLSGKVKKIKKAGSFDIFATIQERTKGATSGVKVLTRFNIDNTIKYALFFLSEQAQMILNVSNIPYFSIILFYMKTVNFQNEIPFNLKVFHTYLIFYKKVLLFWAWLSINNKKTA